MYQEAAEPDALDPLQFAAELLQSLLLQHLRLVSLLQHAPSVYVPE
jgi:hypothetical protein